MRPIERRIEKRNSQCCYPFLPIKGERIRFCHSIPFDRYIKMSSAIIVTLSRVDVKFRYEYRKNLLNLLLPIKNFFDIYLIFFRVVSNQNA